MYTREQISRVIKSVREARPDVTDEDIASIVDEMDVSGLIDHDKSSISPNFSEKNFENWKAGVVAGDVPFSETNRPPVMAPGARFDAPNATKDKGEGFAVFNDAMSVLDRLAGQTLSTITNPVLKSKPDGTPANAFGTFGDADAGVLKPARTKVNESNLPAPVKFGLNLAIGLGEGVAMGGAGALAKAPIKAIKPAMRRGVRDVALARDLATTEAAGSLKSSPNAIIPTSTAIELATNKLGHKASFVEGVNKDLKFTVGEAAGLEGSKSADDILRKEAAAAASTNDILDSRANITAAKPQLDRESVLSDQAKKFIQPLYGKSGEVVGEKAAINLDESVRALEKEYKADYDVIEAEANKAANNSDAVSALDELGIYRVNDAGEVSNLAPRTSTTVKNKSIVMTRNGQPIPVGPRATKNGSESFSSTSKAEGVDGPTSVSDTRAREEWSGDRNPRRAQSYSMESKTSTTKMANEGLSLRDDVSEKVAKAISDVRNNIANGADFTSIKMARGDLYDLRDKLLASNSIEGVGDYRAISEAIDATTNSMNRILAKTYEEMPLKPRRQWQEINQLKKAAEDMQDLRKSLGIEGFALDKYDGQDAFNKIIGGEAKFRDKTSGLALDVLNRAEKAGFLKPGFMKSIEEGFMHDIVKKSLKESADGTKKIIDFESLKRHIESTPKHVFEIALSENSKKDLIRLMVDAGAHEHALNMSTAAASKINKTHPFVTISKTIRDIGLASGNVGMAQLGAAGRGIGGFASMIRGRTSSQIMKTYTGDYNSSRLSGQIGDAFKALKTYAGSTLKRGAVSAKNDARRSIPSYAKTIAPISLSNEGASLSGENP